MKYIAPLNDAEIETLHQMQAHHPSRRARMRAHSLLLSHQRYTIPQIARLSQVDQRRVSAWMERWQTWGLVGLYDRFRSGRPPIFNAEEQQKVYEYLDDSPKDMHKAPYGRTLGTSSLDSGTTRGAVEAYVPRLIRSPSS